MLNFKTRKIFDPLVRSANAYSKKGWSIRNDVAENKLFNSFNENGRYFLWSPKPYYNVKTGKHYHTTNISSKSLAYLKSIARKFPKYDWYVTTNRILGSVVLDKNGYPLLNKNGNPVFRCRRDDVHASFLNALSFDLDIFENLHINPWRFDIKGLCRYLEKIGVGKCTERELSGHGWYLFYYFKHGVKNFGSFAGNNANNTKHVKDGVFESLEKAIGKKINQWSLKHYGGKVFDSHSTNPSRILRVSGTWNNKYQLKKNNYTKPVKCTITYINPKNRIDFQAVDRRFLGDSKHLAKNDFRKKWSYQERMVYIKRVHSKYQANGLKWHHQHEEYLRHDIQWHEENLRRYQIRHHLKIVPLAKLQSLQSRRRTAVGRSQRTQSQYVSSNPLYRKGRSYTANVRRLQGFLSHLKSSHYKLVGYGRVEFAMYIYTGLACLRWSKAPRSAILEHLKSFGDNVLGPKAVYVSNADYVINVTYGKIKRQLERFNPRGKYQYLQDKLGIQIRYYIPTIQQIMQIMGFTGKLYKTRSDVRHARRIKRWKRNRAIKEYQRHGWSYRTLSDWFNLSVGGTYKICNK